MRFNALTADVTADLTERLGPQGVLSAEDAPRFFEEPRGKLRGHARLIARPRSAEDCAFVVARAAEARVPIVPWGGGTGLVGGQTMPQSAAGGAAPILLSLELMSRIREVSQVDNAVTAEAGAVLKAVQEAAIDADRLFPLSLASEGSCTIGGVLSANAGGVGVLRYGNARDLCLGIEAILPNGQVFQGLTPLRKNNMGYDLRHLLIGAEGTLGVITAATLKLFAKPDEVATALCAVARPADAVALLRLLQGAVGEAVTAFELMSAQGVAFVLEHIEGVRDPLSAPAAWSALVDVSGSGAVDRLEEALGAAFDQGLVQDAVVARSEAQRAALWRIREETPIANRKVGAIASHDISLPIGAIADFIQEAAAKMQALDAGLRINCFGHVGDGNLHYNLFPASGRDKGEYSGLGAEITRRIHDLTVAYGGSIAAEHGVGRFKVAELERYGDPAKLSAMRAVKRALDPQGIMNPGAVLDWDSIYGG